MENIPKFDLLDFIHNKKLLTVCAPMVRYSKFQFRTLVRQYGCDLCFTPMILADSFLQSEKARDNEFITNAVDQPLVIQFASNTAQDFVGAAYLASPYCNGVDLNCGCPQRWAKCQGIGCALLDKPELIYDIVRQCRNQISKPFTVSVKLRLLSDLRKSVSICQQLENCGVSFLSIHGRTPAQKTEDVNIEALRIVTETVTCPVIANGGVKTLDDAIQLQIDTNCKGIMVANGLLTNPALFSGATKTPLECVQKWLDICFNSIFEPTFAIDDHIQSEFIHVPEKMKALTYQCFHHHLVFMLEKILPKKHRRIFNNLKNFSLVLDFLNEYLNIKPKKLCKVQHDLYKPVKMEYENRNDKSKALLEEHFDVLKRRKKSIIYDYDEHNGKYFNSVVSSVEDEDDSILNLFSEY